MKKFKSKKKKPYIKIIICILIVSIVYELSFQLLKDKSLVKTNEEFINMMMSNSNYYIKYEQDSLFDKIGSFLSNVDIKKPLTIIENGMGFKTETKKVALTYKNKDDTKNIKEYIVDPNKKKISKPLVYIYNTHQTEDYKSGKLKSYNITPNVLMASYFLKEKLNELNVPTIVEESNVNEFLRLNNWSYDSSYKATRVFILDTINKYKSIKLYIDLHRDALDKELSTAIINNKKYAKVLFVIGLDNKNYKQNMIRANKLDTLLNNKYKGISRGILKKGGDGTNGIFNQDLNNNIVLIECGGNHNTIEEVFNTIEALSQVISEYLGDNNG